jgi:ubiquinone/menaquinone biosynthesis C-methylase UbiE
MTDLRTRRDSYWKESFQQSSVREERDYAAAQWTEYGLVKRLVLFKSLSANLARPGSCVLDAGCGPGNYSSYLASIGCRVAAVDFSENMVRRAKQNPVQESIALGGSLSYAAADVSTLPIKSDSCDLIVCFGVFQHLTESEVTLREFFRVSKRGGYCVINTLSRKFLFAKKKSLLVTYDPLEFKDLCTKIGFQVTSISPMLIFPRILRWFETLEQVPFLHAVLWPCAHDFTLVAEKPG